ncbi:MAG TPA: hypothetical protein EYP10_07725, partial [Armatimonadetes bacterium]|nr:hypothetical protein [Armatimonadota bacterium]
MRSIVIVMVIFVICIANADVGWHIAPDDATKWRMMPTWLGNPSSRASVERVRVDGIDALRFTIPEPRKGMKWVINARWVNIGRYRYLCIRYLARGFNTNSEDYFVYINDGIRHRGQPFSLGLTVLHLSQVKSDGKWHWLVADLQALD